MTLPSWSLSQVAFAFFPLYNSCMRAIISCFSGCDASTCLCVTYLLVLSTHAKDSEVLWAGVTSQPCWLSLLLNFRDVHLVLLKPCCQSGTFQPTQHGLHPVFTTPDTMISLLPWVLRVVFSPPTSYSVLMCALFSHLSLLFFVFYMVLSCLSTSSWWCHSWATSSHTTTCKTFVWLLLLPGICLLIDDVTCELWTWTFLFHELLLYL